jgi:hypothetical protein
MNHRLKYGHGCFRIDVPPVSCFDITSTKGGIVIEPTEKFRQQYAHVGLARRRNGVTVLAPICGQQRFVSSSRLKCPPSKCCLSFASLGTKHA